MKRTAPCPSNWALEQLLLGEAEPSVHQHLAECAECAERLSELRHCGEDYMASAGAAALRSRLAAADAPSKGTPVRPSKVRRLFPASLLTATLATAAAVVLVLRTPGPAPGDLMVSDLTAKGGEQFELWVERNSTTLPLPTTGAGARVNAGERLQTSVGLPSARDIAVLVVTPNGETIPLISDGSGRSTRTDARPTGALGPSFRPDEERGEYRVVGLFSETEFSLDAVMQELAEHQELSFQGVVIERSFRVEPSR